MVGIWLTYGGRVFDDTPSAGSTAVCCSYVRVDAFHSLLDTDEVSRLMIKRFNFSGAMIHA